MGLFLSPRKLRLSLLLLVITLCNPGLQLAEGAAANATLVPETVPSHTREINNNEPSAGIQGTTPPPPPGDKPAPDDQGYTWKPTPVGDLLDRKGLSAFYTINTAFLGAVQPRTIDELEPLFDFSDGAKTAENFRKNWREVLKYGIGYFICAIIGVLLLLIVPISGMFIACCRCCGNCGGRVKPNDKSSSDFGRCCCGFLLFACMAFVLTGGVIMVVLSTDINAQLTGADSVLDATARSSDRIAAYVDTSLGEMRAATLDTYRKTNTEVFFTLDSIIPEVQNKFNATIYLNKLKQFGDSLPSMKTNSEIVKTNATDYTSLRNDLSAKIDITSTNVDSILRNCPSVTCKDAKAALDSLAFVANFSNVNLDVFIQVIGEAEAKNVSGHISSGLEKYEQIFSKANDTLQTETEEAKKSSKDIEVNIEKLLNDVENTLDASVLANFSNTVLKTKEDLVVKNVWMRIPFWVLLGLSVLVLIITFFYYLGLTYGFCGKRADDKNSGCCTWKAGACWLVTGLVFTYIFYFLLMMLLITMFFAGGATHTELCRYAYNLPDSPARFFIDKAVQSVVPNNITFTLSETYRACANNESLYYALKLEQNGVNLSSIINPDDINGAVKKIKDVSITLDPVAFLTQEVEDALKALGDEMVNVNANVQTWREQADYAVLNASLSDIADKLENAANDTTAPDDVKQAAADLRGYESNELGQLNKLKADLAYYLEALKTQTSQDVTALVEGLKGIENQLNTNGSIIVNTVINDTADGLNGTISATADQIKYTVKNDVGRCLPVYEGISGVINKGCVQALYPINGYAFCLGMVIVFLLPAILCAFKLVTLYRKTRPHNAIEDERDLYMAYQDAPYTATKESHNDMLLHRVDRPKSDYIPMADNPVFLDDDQMSPYHIPRAVIRQGTRVLPAQPAAPDDSYFYAMPARGIRAAEPLPPGHQHAHYNQHHAPHHPHHLLHEPPPSYTRTARTQV